MNPRVLYRAATYAADARSTADAVISALTPAAWYRNATGVTSAGGFASQWDDYSGNARHLVQTTGTNQPAYAAGVLSFDGADNYMKASAFTLNQPLTIVLLMKQISWTSNEYFCDGDTDATVVLRQLTTTPNIQAYAAVGACDNTDLSVGAFGVVVGVFNNASSSLKVNNNAKVTGTTGTNNAGGFTLGSIGAGNFRWSNIAVKEAVLIPSAISDTDASSIVTALLAI